MRITVDRSVLEKLLDHAAFAAHLVGHLDDEAHAALIDQLGDHVDAVVHGLTELLGCPDEFSEHAAPLDRAAHVRPARHGASLLPSIPGARS